jgi:hypothetical protein
MLGLCTDNKLPYIMSEFIEGFTVKSYIQNKGELMSWPLFHLVKQFCRRLKKV